jgi:hypothetical protein
MFTYSAPAAQACATGSLGVGIMEIDLISFFFGVVLTLAIILVAERVYGRFFGNKELRKLRREVKRMQGILRKKDELIKKSLKDMETRENSQ